nr:G-protein coupled receptor Mth2 isoform X1 [Helicoverpa armigera]
MVTLKVFLLLFLTCAAEDVDYKAMCTRAEYRDMDNKLIDNVEEYCRNKLCVIKCCGDNMLLSNREVCMTEQALQKRNPEYSKQIKEQHDYNKVKLYTRHGHGVKESTKSAKDIVFITKQNYTKCSYDMRPYADFYILEDGSGKAQKKDGSKAWYDLGKLEYCVEYKIYYHNRTQYFIMREPFQDPDGAETKSMYALVGFKISLFFLILTLLVYCLLPDLQNLIGLIMMAYITTLIFVFLLKCIIILTNSYQTRLFCKIISAMLYFCALSSFFWLNVMAFDVYVSLSRPRSSRGSNKRVKYRKFAMYAVYALGAPLLVTAIVTVLDNIDVSELAIDPTPPFADCMAIGVAVTYYFAAPIGVLISINIILFLMTVYNIWKISREVTNNPNSKKSNQNNKFYICLKLSLIMGVTWMLELFEGKGIFIFILLNTYNLLTGALIFFLFVFKKKIFVKLCIRFNIDHEWVRTYEPSMRSKSGITRSTRLSKSKKNSQIKETETVSMMNENNCTANEETSTV